MNSLPGCGHEGQQAIGDVLDDRFVAQRPQLAGGREHDVEATSGAGSLDDVDGLVQARSPDVDVALPDAGDGEVAQDDRARLTLARK